MRRTSILLAVPLLLAARPAPAADEGTPRVLFIEREEIKPGKMGAHGRLIERLMRVDEKARIGTNVLTLMPVTGDENSGLFLFPFASWGALEEWLGKWQAASAAHATDFEAIEKEGGETHARQKAMIAVHQPDLSFRPRGAAAAKTRYLFVTWLRVEPGRVAQWREDVKWTNGVWEKSGTGRHWSVWSVASGTDLRTFLRLEAVTSLAEVDGWADEAKKLREGLDPESRKRWEEMGRETKPEGASALYAFDAAHSVAPKAWVEQDPAFWTPKPAARPAAKK